MRVKFNTLYTNTETLYFNILLWEVIVQYYILVYSRESYISRHYILVPSHESLFHNTRLKYPPMGGTFTTLDSSIFPW